MLLRFLFFVTIATPVVAGTIDSGTIITYGLSDTIWNVNISSASGNYSVHFSPSGETLLSCVLCPTMHPGDFVTLSSTEGFDVNSTGFATIGGTFYPTLIFDSAGLGIFSVMHLNTSFTAGAPGLFIVPFTMTGVLQAGTAADPAHFVLNETVSGQGYAQLNLLQSGTLDPQIIWTFTPEASTVGLMGFGLTLISGAWVHRSRHSGYADKLS